MSRQVSSSCARPFTVLDSELLPTDSDGVTRVDVLIVWQTNVASGLEGWGNDPRVVKVERDTDVAGGSVYTWGITIIWGAWGTLEGFALGIAKS